MVTVPRGVVDNLLDIEAGGVNDDPEVDVAELMVDAGLKVMLLMSDETDFSEFSDVCPVELIEDFLEGASGASNDTIFMPTEVPVDAGMKSVVTPCFLITVRCGWKLEQHGELVSPVEYE